MITTSASPRLGFTFYIFLWLLYKGYALGFNAPFQFDDYSNLSWLSDLDDEDHVLASIFSGGAGPLGRPLSLAAFLLDGYHWPISSLVFHRTNALLHLLNAALLLLILLRIRPKSSGAFTSMFCVFLWAALPILASSVLLVVQRMTLLSAAFTLSGVWCYLTGRNRLALHPRQGLAIIICSLAATGLCAVLSKENGALLPLYVLVLECTLLPPFPATLSKHQKNLIWLLLATPVIAIGAYLAQLLFNASALNAAYDARPFTLSQRLQTEAVILWDYLRLAFIPQISSLGPFHEGYPLYTVQSHPVLVWSSCLAWFTVIAAAFYWRKKTPLLLFAVAWYLGGHLLESTIIPLELFFEHRNYLPLIGPVYALVAGATGFFKSAALRYAVLGVYLGMQFFMLLQTAELWGDPVKSGHYWVEKQPDSIRAAQFLAQQLQRQGRLRAANQALQNAAVRHPDDAALLLQGLQLQCELRSLPETAIKQSLEKLSKAQYSPAAVPTLNALLDLAAIKRCPAVDAANMRDLLNNLTDNKAFARHAQYHMHHLKARLYEQQGRLSPAILELEEALKINPSLDTFLRISSILMDAGFFSAAQQPLIDAQQYLPRNPFVRRYWLRELDAHSKAIQSYQTEKKI